MLTAQQIAFAQLEYIGETSLTLVEYTGTAAAGVMRALVLAQNAGMMALYEANPTLFKREIGLDVLAPAAGTVGVTKGSTTVTAPTFTGHAGPFAGNTIQIAGQAEWNGLRTEGATTKLVFPYTGTTGTQAATLYGNALLLDATLSRPIGPVWLSDIRVLTPLGGKPAYLGFDPLSNLRTDWNRVPSGLRLFPQTPRILQPEAYYAEAHTLEAGGSQVRLFVTPLPDKAYSLRFDAAVRPLPVVLSTDIGDDDSTDPWTSSGRNFGLPDGKDEAWLLPLVLYTWSRSAFFKNDKARAQIAADRAAILREIEDWKVQTTTGSYIQPVGWR